jgi:hypothetical protein
MCDCGCLELWGMIIGLFIFFLFHQPIIKWLEIIVDKIKK